MCMHINTYLTGLQTTISMSKFNKFSFSTNIHLFVCIKYIQMYNVNVYTFIYCSITYYEQMKRVKISASSHPFALMKYVTPGSSLSPLWGPQSVWNFIQRVSNTCKYGTVQSVMLQVYIYY